MDGVFVLLAELIGGCSERRTVFPLTVGVVGADGSSFYLRVTSDARVTPLYRHPHNQVMEPLLPISISVIDKAGSRIHARIAADNPDKLLLLAGA
jgi:hypothetical protein